MSSVNGTGGVGGGGIRVWSKFSSVSDTDEVGMGGLEVSSVSSANGIGAVVGGGGVSDGDGDGASAVNGIGGVGSGVCAATRGLKCACVGGTSSVNLIIRCRPSIRHKYG